MQFSRLLHISAVNLGGRIAGVRAQFVRGDYHIPLDRHWQHKSAVIVGVLANQVHTAWRRDKVLRRRRYCF